MRRLLAAAVLAALAAGPVLARARLGPSARELHRQPRGGRHDRRRIGSPCCTWSTWPRSRPSARSASSTATPMDRSPRTRQAPMPLPPARARWTTWSCGVDRVAAPPGRGERARAGPACRAPAGCRRCASPAISPRPPATGGSLAIIDTTDDGHVGWREVTIAAGRRRPTSAKPTSPTAANRPTSAPTRSAGWSLPRRAAGSCLVPGGRWRSAIVPPPTWPHRQPIRGPPIRWPRCWRGTSRRRSWRWRCSSPPAWVRRMPCRRGMARRSWRHTWSAPAEQCARPSALGLTVAFAHTAGVLLLGMLVLVAGELLLPETLIGWLTIASGCAHGRARRRPGVEGARRRSRPGPWS